MSSINSNSGHYDNLNSSIVPINASESFVGRYSSCLNYALIEVSVKTDSIYDIKCVYSADGVNDEFTDSQSVVAVSSDTLFYRFEPKMRYYRIQLNNTDINNQTVLSLQTLLKSTLTYSSASGTSSDVNIISPLIDGNVAVNLTNFNDLVVDISGQVVNISGQTVDISGQTVVVDGLNNIYNIVNSKGSLQLYNGSTASPSSTVNLSTVNNKSISIFGNVDAACILTIQMSNDSSNWYSSQYSYTLTTAGDFGFCLVGLCSNYIRLICNNSVNATVYANWC